MRDELRHWEPESDRLRSVPFQTTRSVEIEFTLVQAPILL